MNPIAEEIASYLGSASMTEEEFIKHYGVGHLDGGHSGRYEWGSGKDPYQRERTFLDRINKLRSEGWKETAENIKKEFGLSIEDYRMEKTIANNYIRAQNVARAKQLRDEGKSNTEIGKIMGVRESTVRGWWNEDAEYNMNLAKNTAELLKQEVEKKRYD
jgi:hypothetical protein